MSSSERKTVLVVNNDRVQARLIALLLEKDGIEVLVFASVEEAVVRLVQSTPADLIVTDMHLPGIDGWRFCRLLRSPEFHAWNSIPVLVTSPAYPHAGLDPVIGVLGADAFLAIPYEPSVLRARVRELLERQSPCPTRTVLVASGQGEQLERLARPFRTRGDRVLLARTMDEAVDLGRANPPHCILLGPSLPDQRSSNPLPGLRSAFPHAILLIAGDAPSREQALRAFALEADGFFTEPVEPARIDALCASSRIERCLLQFEQVLRETSRRLRGSEDRFRLITDQIPAVLYTTDAELRITSSVGGALSRLNLKPHQLVGMKLTEYYRSDDPEFLPLEAHARALRGEKVTYEMEWEGRMWHTRLEPLYDASGRIHGTTGVSVDITHRRQTELELNARMRQQAAVAQLSQAALRGPEITELADTTARLVAETLDVDFCELFEVMGSGDAMRLFRGVGWEPGLVGRLTVPIHSPSTPGYPLASREPLVIENLREDSRAPGLGYLLDRGVATSLSTVLHGRRGPYGVFGAHSRRPRRFTEQDIHFFQAAANILASARERRESEQRQRSLSLGLHAVVSVADQLIQCAEVDELYRLAVELAREKLGVERCALYLEEPGGQILRGTYGTDDRGRTTREHSNRVPREKLLKWMQEGQAGEQENRWILRTDLPWTYWDGEKTVTFGCGWIASTPIRSSRGQIGILFNDAAMSHAPFDEVRQEILAIFASVLGTLIEQKGTEEALRDSEEKYRALFLESKDAIFISTPEGRYLDMNPAGIEMLGYSSKEEVLLLDIGRDLYFDRSERDRFLRAVEEKGYVKDFELRLKRKDGQAVIVQATVSAVRDSHGRVVAYRGTRRDITEQKRLQQQLLQAQKMESIGTLAGGIAHDFNNILTGIIGYAELALSMLDPGSRVYQFVANIPEQGQRAAGLISQLLAFSRRAITRMEPISLMPLLKEISKMLRRTLPENIEIRLNVSGEVDLVNADPTQMQQVVMNLATNAQDAMPAGGVLTFTLENVALDLEYCRRYPFAQPGRYVCLTVTDTGTGMPPEVLEHIFEPFFTTKEVGKGTGLGLSMVYGIVKTHKGHITVSSRVAVGSEFKVHLPVIETEAPRTGTGVTVDKKIPDRGHETVLLVEDETMVLQVGQQMLQSLGYQVLTARNGREGLERFHEHHQNIHLVVLDLVMPEMGGEELFFKLHEIDPALKVVLMSGYSIQEKLDGLRDHGLKGFVLKPFTLQSLGRAVRDALDAAG
ncbi:MAG: response regulator [Planctomycetes bacterium]|nr:response regulator [Planctomycetota bacterium]